MNEDESRIGVLRSVAERLGVSFSDIELLDRALTHASVACESAGPTKNYESLEFLGDAALGLAIAHSLIESFPGHTPGEYSRMRAAVVNRRCLARVAARLNLGEAIRLGKGEESSGGRKRASLLEDCLEATIGAVFLDQGWEAARAFVGRVLKEELEQARALDEVWDYKSRLQHYCQAERMALPKFEVVRSEGPDHRKRFEVEVVLRNESVGRGSGLTKKEAEQNAARAALVHENQLAG